MSAPSVRIVPHTAGFLLVVDDVPQRVYLTFRKAVAYFTEALL